MDPLSLKALAATGSRLLSYLKDPVKRRLAVWRAARSGGAAASVGLSATVKVELRRICNDRFTRFGIPKEVLSNWLLKTGQPERFAAVLTGIAAGSPKETYETSYNELAATYSEVTGEDARVADGPIRMVVDVVTAALKDTDSGRSRLSLALAVQTAAAANDQRRQHLGVSEVMTRVRRMSDALLATAEKAWPAPPDVSPIALYLYSAEESSARESVSVERAIELAGTSERTAFIGDGGVGKTTLLHKLAAALAHRTDVSPLVFDAAAWASTGANLFAYLAGRPEAAANAITQQELWEQAKAGKLLLLINGWNEIAGAQRHRSVQELQATELAASGLKWVLTTRSPSDYPTERNVTIFEVEGLRWKEQSKQIRARLKPEDADELENLLATDSDLRYAARRPLVLRGVIELAARGSIEQCSTLDFLASAVHQHEQRLPRLAVLDDAPLDGYARQYLEGIATAMVAEVATVIDREPVLQAITRVARLLVSDGRLSTPPRASDVLAALTGQHLLQAESDKIRFSHQLFQEFFAANALLNSLILGDPESEVLKSAVTAPGWAEALALVSEVLRQRSLVRERTLLVSSALRVDLGLACDLAGQSGFDAADDEATYQLCVESVRRLASLTEGGVQAIGTSLMIASRWPCFANELWALLEHPDQQVRLTTYRQESSGIRLSQLGSGASVRIQTWPADRQSEFIHESARAHENFDFVRGLAHHAHDPVVREAAISALLWDFPASPDGLRAWAGAPTRTQVGMLEHVSAALEGIDEPPETSKALTDLIPTLDSSGMVRFARNFPNRTPESFADAIAGDLLGGADRYQRDVDALLEVLERIAPGRAGKVAKELTCRGRDAPDWAEQMVTDSAELAASVRQTLLSRLAGQPGQPLNAELLGRVAEPQTIQQLLDLLPIANQDSAGLDTQYSAVRRALQYSDGNVFLGGVLLRAQRGDERAEIAKQLWLLVHRSEPQHSSDSPPKWAPTVGDMETLIRACKELLELEWRDRVEDEIRTSLCLLAAASSCKHFRTFVLDGVARHLDLWSNYRERLSRTPAREPRPANPSYGQLLRSALVACGPDVVDELLAMAAHPESEVLIPEILSAIAATHFTSGQRPPLQETVATAFARGRQTPVGVSEDARLISISRYFSEQLARRTAAFMAEGDETKRRHLANSVGKWAAQTSRIPGEHVSAAVVEAVRSGALEVFNAVDVVRARAGYGHPVRDSQSLAQVTALLDSKERAWSHDNEHYWIGELAAYFVCVIPDAELPRPWETYFALWLKYSYWHAVTRACQAGGCIRAWDVLERLVGLKGDAGETAFDTMVHLLDANTFPRLMNFIRQGTVPTDHAFRRHLGDRISHIAHLIASNPALKQMLVDACRSSPMRSADGVAIRALARVELNEALVYFLGTVDAGHLDAGGGWRDTELLSIFTSFRRELDESSFEVFPAACNELRAALYERAANHAASAEVSRRLLADIECQRREDGRPDAELRHPLRADGRQWMHIFDVDLARH